MKLLTRKHISKGKGIVSSVSEGGSQQPYRRAVLPKTDAEQAVIDKAFASKPLFARLDRCAPLPAYTPFG